MAIGLTNAVRPRINDILTILDPITLPIAISAVAPGATVNDATKLTASSGKEVPNATSVKPITKGETLNFLAIDEDDETKKSAPLTRKIKPTINNKILKKLSIKFILFIKKEATVVR